MRGRVAPHVLRRTGQRRPRPGARAAGPGHHRLAPAAHVSPPRAGRVGGGARRRGGVGSLAAQLAREWGAGRIIATASTPEKRRLAEDLGADAVVDSTPEGLTLRLRGANRGKAVDVVLEMVGGEVFEASYAVLAPFGRLVTYGTVSGTEAKPPTIGSLMRQSRTVAGFWLPHALRDSALTTKIVTELSGSPPAVACARWRGENIH